MFIFHMTDREGNKQKLHYDPHTSSLTLPDGSPIIANIDETAKWKSAIPVNKENPGKKIKAPTRLKIQLGLGCNYSCSYCLQSAQIHKAAASSTADTKIFLKTLNTWLEGTPKQIEFWGGEPLLYWNKLKVLVPELKQRFPETKMLIITNGTLFTKEIVDQLVEWDFGVGMSHDGPGQSLRGDDPFEDPTVKENIDYAVMKLTEKNKFSFNSVLTSKSYNPEEIINWFKQLYPLTPVTFEGVVHSYDDNDESRFTEEQLQDMTKNVTLQIMYKTALVGSISNKSEDFVQSLFLKRPSNALYQKCGMDREDQLAVDLLGNVLTCQNVGGKAEHKIGHVRSFDKIALNTATHWSFKEECKTCPVLQLCKGSCMYLEGDNWAASCNAEFAINKAILAGTLFNMTGLVLERIEGHMIRPSLPKSRN
jgi:uncharacterized protein